MDPLYAMGLPTRHRDLANLRERRRMMLINRGFEQLRNRLPLDNLIICDNSRNLRQKIKRRAARLTKVDILKLTILYINQLKARLSGDELPPFIGDSSNLSESDKVIEIKSRTTCKSWLETSDFGAGRSVPGKRSGSHLGDSECGDEHLNVEWTAPIRRGTKVQLGSSKVCKIDGTTNVLERNQSPKVGIKIRCREGKFYSLSWSKSSEMSSFHSRDEFLVELKKHVTRKVIRNTKLWKPETGSAS